MMSNRGGVAVRPVTATRMAMNRSPTFQPRVSHSDTEAGLQLLGLEAHRRQLADDAACLGEAIEGRRGIPALGHQQRGLDGQVIPEEEVDERTDGVEPRQPVADHGQDGGQVVSRRHADGSACGSSGLEVRGEERKRPLDQVRVGQSADPLAIEPVESLPVEDRAALLDPVEVEALR